MRKTIRVMVTMLAVVVAAASASGCSYNTFTTQEEAIKAQWAQVENQLQRRSDLIPNLVETTKGFAQQEKDVFGAVADARAKMAGATTPAQKIDAANQESSALARLLVVVEAYPQLKSDATFARLMDELSGTENRLATERMRYNERVQEYSTARKKFPGNITAKVFNFDDHPYWQVPADAKTAPKVNFGKMIRPVLLAEFDHEMAVTRRLLERCPANFDWTPHQRSYTLGGLATHLARLPRWGEWILANDGYDLVLDHKPQSPAHATLPDVLDTFDKSIGTARTHLTALSDAELAAPWELRKNGETIMTLPRMSAFKTLVVNHTIHHRGQLSVYLRLLDVPLPAIYGPTADEPM